MWNTRKMIHAQAKDNTGTIVFDLQLEGKKRKQSLLSQAITAIQETGGVIRYQEINAKSWAKYRVEPGQNFAVMDQEIDWPE